MPQFDKPSIGTRQNSRYLTTSIPYVNAPPHVGFAMEMIQADCLARHYRLEGHTVRFQAGTDENSLKNVQAAEAIGIPVQTLVGRNADRFYELKEALDLSLTTSYELALTLVTVLVSKSYGPRVPRMATSTNGPMVVSTAPVANSSTNRRNSTMAVARSMERRPKRYLRRIISSGCRVTKKNCAV